MTTDNMPPQFPFNEIDPNSYSVVWKYASAYAEQETKELRDLLERAADMISHDTGLRQEIDAFLKDKP